MEGRCGLACAIITINHILLCAYSPASVRLAESSCQGRLQLPQRRLLIKTFCLTLMRRVRSQPTDPLFVSHRMMKSAWSMSRPHLLFLRMPPLPTTAHFFRGSCSGLPWTNTDKRKHVKELVKQVGSVVPVERCPVPGSLTQLCLTASKRCKSDFRKLSGMLITSKQQCSVQGLLVLHP